jgi:hypothetical protein
MKGRDEGECMNSGRSNDVKAGGREGRSMVVARRLVVGCSAATVATLHRTEYVHPLPHLRLGTRARAPSSGRLSRLDGSPARRELKIYFPTGEH